MARATRAETLTGSSRKIEFYSDFLNSFAKTPVGNQLGRVINEKSIQQALKNIILTNLGERFFQPYIGSGVNALLFENNITEVLTDLQFQIELAIRNCEKRVNLIGVDVTDGQSEHEVIVTIVYNTINNPEPITFEYILKRVR
jgi:phage baseplate assembly protein W